MAKVIVWGTGRLAEVLTYYLEHDSPHEIVAYCKDASHINEGEISFYDRPVVSFEEVVKKYPPRMCQFAVFIGFKELNKIREQKFKLVKSSGYKCISYISSQAEVCGTVGENSYLLSHNTVQPFSHIGNNVILWMGCNIGHHTTIADHCFLAQSTVAGCTHIGKNCFLGVNSTVVDNTSIGQQCIIGAGVTVIKKLPDGAILTSQQAQPLPLKSWEFPGLLN